MTEEQKLLCDSLFDLSQCAHSDISIALDAMEVIEEQDAELSRLRGEVERLTKEANKTNDPDNWCEECGGFLTMCGQQNDDGEPELDCPRCAERRAIAEAVRDIENEHPKEMVIACNNLADRIEGGQI
jgi:hypothetical protein